MIHVLVFTIHPIFFLPVSVKHVKISALLDSGSTINIMSMNCLAPYPNTRVPL